MKNIFIKFIYILIFSNFFVCLTVAQNSIPIKFQQIPSRNTQIGSFKKNSVLYSSLNDIAQVLNFRIYINRETKKFELRTEEYAVKVTADNPYVAIIDKRENANLLQLPVNVIYAANSFFVPLEAFIEILNDVSPEEIILEKETIIVGQSAPKSSFDITGLGFEEKSNGFLIEKDVTLSVALKLGNLIEKNLPGVDVVYTRKTDDFVELYRRGQIANQNGGKLFISIHCNSMPRRNHTENGFEIYLLRPGKTESALRIAERENEVVKLEQDYEKRYQQLTEENFILLTMAQSAYVKYSEQFAGILQQEMGRHLKLNNNGVKQAGFYVLVGASMPNVLVETAYLSNKNDEKFLRSSSGQQNIAEAIFNGVKRYKQEYEKSLSEGREIGSW
ncbi:MAG: N-acetylmuramoyl-L-alanine amidase [Ignavibacteriales bacterium]|nr:N-acetylmuramoyl-L-alanine amidase [Ignavibacteriales bacterium]